MRFLLTILAICAWMFFLPQGRGETPEWFRYRGPNMNGLSPEPGQLGNMPPGGLTTLWTSQVGTGHASVVISGGLLYTTGNRTNLDTVYCLNATNGHVVWSNSYSSALFAVNYEGGTSGSPTIDGDRVFTLGKWGDLFCFNRFNGSILWRTNIQQAHQLRLANWGLSSAPLVDGHRLYLNAGGRGMALNKNNGRLIWLNDTNRNGYATPVPWTADGVPSLLIFSLRELVSVRAEDGLPQWAIPWMSYQDINASDPIPYNGRFLATSDARPGSMITFTNGALATNWSHPSLSTHLSPGVVISNHLYTFAGNAKLGPHYFICVNMDTGVQRWVRTDLLVGSIIGVGNRLVVLDGSGKLLILNADPSNSQNNAVKLQVLNATTFAPPAFNRGVLYVRDISGTLKALAMPWTPEATPIICIQNTAQPGRVVVSWPAGATNYQLQAAALAQLPAGWTAVTNPPTVVGGSKVVTNEATGDGKAFRLLKP